jgi:predicted ferric reductase
MYFEYTSGVVSSKCTDSKLCRKYFYELFVGTHILSAVLYLAFMFWHCEDLLTSWTYLWTTAALWLASVLLRFMNTTFNAALPCTLRLLPGDAVMVTIPTTHIWTPAQHVFLRFPGLSVFDNHPFSVCSVSENSDELNTLVVVVKPRSGFTRLLFLAAAEDGPEAAMRVVVDGPYGGVPRAVESFQGVVLVAGGSGVTAVVGVLSWLVRCMRRGEGCVEKIKLVWAVKDRRTLEWFGGEVAEAVAMAGVECRFFVTGDEGESEKMEAVDGVEIAKGRPDCGRMLEEWVGGMGERVCVVGMTLCSISRLKNYANRLIVLV